jgi:hypothetical protein
MERISARQNLCAGLSIVVLLAAAAAPPAHASPPAPPGKPPPTPVIAPGAHTFVALAGRPAPVRLAWPAVPSAARYRARWMHSGTLVDVELPGTATAFERQVSSVGHHQLTLIAIDAAGRESAPVEVGVDVIAVAAIAPGFDEPSAPNPSAAASTAAFAVGARFRSTGLACRLGDGQAGREVMAREAGATTLRCDGEPALHIQVPVVIAPVIVDVLAPKRPLPRGTATTVHLTVASVAQLGEKLEVEPEGDLGVADVRRTPHGLELAVTPREGTTSAALVVRSRGVALGRTELAIAEAPRAPAPLGETWLWLELGYHVGLFAPTEAPAIDDAHKPLVAGPLAGGRVSVFPTQRVGVEGELGVAALDHRGGRTGWFVSARAQLAFRAVDRGRFGLRLLGGAGLLRTSGAIQYGGALTFETHPNLWLRFQALDAITAARDAGYAHCIELQLGVVTSLGRRDRGW